MDASVLRAKAAAGYLGLSVSAFQREVAAGRSSADPAALIIPGSVSAPLKDP